MEGKGKFVVSALVVVGTLILLSGLVTAQSPNPLVDEVKTIMTAVASGQDAQPLLDDLAARYCICTPIPERPKNEQLTSDAWDALNKLDYATAIQKTEECIDSFELQAIRDQEALKDSPMPPVGAVGDEDKAVIQARGVLNDVATCYFIKGQALEKLDRISEAKEAYQGAQQFPYGRTWDPLGWFWSPADAAADRLAKLP